MTITLGVDVSKSFLDVFHSESKHFHRFDNSSHGIQSLFDSLALNPSQTHIVLESTGVYHAPLVAQAQQKQINVSVVNPLRIRLFARARGKKAKTDRIDAQTICEFAQVMPLRLTPPPSQNLVILRDLLRARTHLKDQLTALKLHRSTHTETTSSGFLDDCIQLMLTSIQTIEEKLHATLQSDPSLSETYACLISAPGIGEVCAWTLMAFLPELGKVSGKEIAALVGVAPYTQESGLYKGRASISGGRRVLRNVLYMGIMGSAYRPNSPIYRMHHHFIKAGKPVKVSLIACMRKVLVRLNAMLKKKERWIS